MYVCIYIYIYIYTYIYIYVYMYAMNYILCSNGNFQIQLRFYLSLGTVFTR